MTDQEVHDKTLGDLLGLATKIKKRSEAALEDAGRAAAKGEDGVEAVASVRAVTLAQVYAELMTIIR